MSFPYAEIEERLGYRFRDKELLKRAFTHASYAKENNERLEYLGDSVLQMVVTEWQYGSDERAEGKLSAARQRLVCEASLESAVDALGIFPYMLVRGSAQNVSRKTRSDLFEAVSGAIYLDGGYSAARKFILQRGNFASYEERKNYKGDLQEFLQKRGEQPPTYTSQKEGSDHSPVFHCEVSALGERARGSGKSKHEAESVAAARLLWELEGGSKDQGKESKRV